MNHLKYDDELRLPLRDEPLDDEPLLLLPLPEPLPESESSASASSSLRFVSSS